MLRNISKQSEESMESVLKSQTEEETLPPYAGSQTTFNYRN